MIQCRVCYAQVASKSYTKHIQSRTHIAFLEHAAYTSSQSLDITDLSAITNDNINNNSNIIDSFPVDHAHNTIHDSSTQSNFIDNAFATVESVDGSDSIYEYNHHLSLMMPLTQSQLALHDTHVDMVSIHKVCVLFHIN